MSVHWNVARGWDYNRVEMKGEVVQHANKDAAKHVENHHSVCGLTLCVHSNASGSQSHNQIEAKGEVVLHALTTIVKLLTLKLRIHQMTDCYLQRLLSQQVLMETGNSCQQRLPL